MRLRGAAAVITGASSGIGRAAAAELARRGAVPALVARDAGRLREAAAGLPPGAVCVPCDVSDPAAVEAMASEVLGRLGRADLLVNCAGFASYGPVAAARPADVAAQAATNYLGTAYCTMALLPHMLGRGSGHVVNVASLAASFGLPGLAAYCASKSAVLGFSAALWHELRGTGVGVTVVSPAAVRTPFFGHPSFAGARLPGRLALDPRTVARAIARAAGSPRLEIAVPAAARAAVWARQTLPYAVDPLVGALFGRAMRGARGAG